MFEQTNWTPQGASAWIEAQHLPVASNVHNWSQSTATPFVFNAANSSNDTSSSSKPWQKTFLGNLDCVHNDGTIQILNPHTQFSTPCFLSGFGAVWALLFLWPLFARIRELRQFHGAGDRTVSGQIATFAAFLSSIFVLLYHGFVSKTPISPAGILILASTVVAGLSQRVQDGRVVVSSAEILSFWLGEAFVYVGWAIHAYLASPDGLKRMWLFASAATSAVIAFALESYNPERHPEYKYSDFSIFSRMSIAFATPVMKKCKKESIDHRDLSEAPADIEAHSCGLIFAEDSKKRMDKSKATDSEEKRSAEGYGRWQVFRSIFAVAGPNILKALVVTLLGSFVESCIPIIVLSFLHASNEYQSGSSPLYQAYYIGALIGLFPLAQTCLESISQIQVSYSESKVRSAVLTTLYRKSLNLSPGAREKYDSSSIMNLMSVDSSQVFTMMDVIPDVFSMPIMSIVSTWQLWELLGYSFFGAAIVYVFLIPFQTVMSAKIGVIFPELMKYLDKRNKATSNLFRSIKSSKLYAWEHPFCRKVRDVRAQELGIYRTIMIITTTSTTSFNCTSDFVAVAIFSCFLYLKQGVLSPEVVFPSLSLLQFVSTSFIMSPMVIVSFQQGLTSCSRLYKFYSQPDDKRENYYHEKQGVSGYHAPTIIVDKATLSWNGEDTEEKIPLKDVSFKANRGDLVCIVGRVGTGKTALLRSLTGDLSIRSGSITVKGNLSYSGQESWLQNMTLQENILFGQALDEEWYEQVIEACELNVDIENSPKGNDTNVGERGISLSGGQKARVALARAVYSRSDIILLDDVSSAVDEHVSAASIRKSFSIDGSLGNRTVVSATNNIKVLSHSSRIVALADKQIAESSSFSEVVKQGEASSIYRIIEEFGHADDLKKSHEEVADRIAAIEERSGKDMNAFKPTTTEQPAELVKFDIYSQKSDEEDEKVVSSLRPFIRYYFSDRPWFTWLSIGISLVSIVFRNGIIAYLGVVASHNFTNSFDARWYFATYIGIATCVASFLMLNIIFIEVILASRNSQISHDQMSWSVVRAPMTFFDKTPLGRLINRFTADLSSVDNGFASVGSTVVRAFLNVVVTVISICAAAPQVLLIVIPLGWWANQSRVSYVPAQRKITRIFSAANSPILSHVEETIKGQAIVRSFGHVHRFDEIFVDRVNYWVKASFFKVNLIRWLRFRVNMISTILSFGGAMCMTQLIGWGYIGVSFAGVILNFCERTGVMVGQTIQALANAETRGVSLERLFEYIDMPTEAPEHIEATEPSGTWPSKGEITFDNSSVKYTEDGPQVLSGLTFKVNSGEKIGVVGRTGSGKSTSTLAIFRIVEACGGRIEMDKIDASILGLGDLRSRLSIVPQDSQIFDATVRDNLDPLHTKDDAELWEILEQCHLKSHFEKFEGLDTELVDSGSQSSRGQAQSSCLGRALVHKSKILVLDEATASVDHETDKIIQETIRTQLADRTIITIAHRLNTIMDSDRVLVLDKGEMKEFDTPERSLEAKGLFYSSHNTEKFEDEHE